VEVEGQNEFVGLNHGRGFRNAFAAPQQIQVRDLRECVHAKVRAAGAVARHQALRACELLRGKLRRGLSAKETHRAAPRRTSSAPCTVLLPASNFCLAQPWKWLPSYCRTSAYRCMGTGSSLAL
jgi:hypothetical protein